MNTQNAQSHNRGTSGGGVTQRNGTKRLFYNKGSASMGGVRDFDIGNNAKYDAIERFTSQNTNVLPSDFWNDSSDSDSQQERQETADEIAERWKLQKSHIAADSDDENAGSRFVPGLGSGSGSVPPPPPQSQLQSLAPHPMRSGLSAPIFDDQQFGRKPQGAQHQRVRSLYDVSSSDEEDGDGDGAKSKEKGSASSNEWVVDALNLRWQYDSEWFKIAKLNNGKANGQQLRPFMEQSGLSKESLKRIWRLSDLDKDGKMGSEEFALCMLLMDEAKKGKAIPDKLPPNYIPPSFRGKKLVKTPPKKRRPPSNVPPSMRLNGNVQNGGGKPMQNVQAAGVQGGTQGKIANRAMVQQSVTARSVEQ